MPKTSRMIIQKKKGITRKFIELEGEKREVVGMILLRLKEKQYRSFPVKKAEIKEGEVKVFKELGLILMNKKNRLYSLVLKGPH